MNNLGCGKYFKRINGDNIETDEKHADFLCGVPNAWGTEIFCIYCKNRLRDKWKKEDDNKQT